MQLLADGPLGATREDGTLPLKETYLDAFEAIDADPNNALSEVAHGEP